MSLNKVTRRWFFLTTGALTGYALIPIAAKAAKPAKKTHPEPTQVNDRQRNPYLRIVGNAYGPSEKKGPPPGEVSGPALE